MIHSVDEFVEIDQLVEMLKIVLVTAVDWCGLPE
jgi:acetylornithine deacetylase/succinyl-diaminopimelate desuccinylase-like protein